MPPVSQNLIDSDSEPNKSSHLPRTRENHEERNGEKTYVDILRNLCNLERSLKRREVVDRGDRSPNTSMNAQDRVIDDCSHRQILKDKVELLPAAIRI